MVQFRVLWWKIWGSETTVPRAERQGNNLKPLVGGTPNLSQGLGLEDIIQKDLANDMLSMFETNQLQFLEPILKGK